MDAPRFGKVLVGIPWIAWVWGVLAGGIFLAGLFPSRDSPMPAIIGGMMLLGLGIALYPRILRIPVVQTTEEGIIIRSPTKSGKIFYKWEDVQEVVVWYQRTGGDKSTMIGIRPRINREPDNYGRYPLVKPSSRRIDGSFPTYVGDLVGKWSIHIGSTSARKVAALVSDSGKGVPVMENLLWSDSVRVLTE